MFKWSYETEIISDCKEKSVKKAIYRLRRDMHFVLRADAKEEHPTTVISVTICPQHFEEAEAYCIDIQADKIQIEGKDELGVIYGLNYLSETFLGILPFWFWNDQVFGVREYVEVPETVYRSTKAKVRHRGWFINDEVLLTAWQVDGSHEKPWEMAFEALLRCGGNMVIPGTDHNNKLYRTIASDMGLWITQHHAEPLGAEMFARVYPELEASYAVHSELFQELWRKGIEEQKHMKIIWNLGFRGQGDRPFWADDPRYDTPQVRGELLSSLIQIQYDMVKERVENPVCCVNLYGEIMELYKDGFIHIPSDIIMIWADNGYGKMVSRRQGNHNPRVVALPNKKGENKHGIYYHVSFYDLQAANHITMLPNQITFINDELKEAFERGCTDFLVVNASNIKPHVFSLDAVKYIWQEGDLNAKNHCRKYVEKYFGGSEAISKCFDAYAQATVAFGEEKDEHAGEQFYHYTTRQFCYKWVLGETKETVEGLKWATGEKDFAAQMSWYSEKCRMGEENFKKLYEQCIKVKQDLSGTVKMLFEDSIELQNVIHLESLRGAIWFAEAYKYFNKDNYPKAFVAIGRSMAYYQRAVECLKKAEHDKWSGFYANECLTDMKQTVYLLESVRHFIRNKAEGPHFYDWQRTYIGSEADRRVVLITNWTNHPKDEEIYEVMKDKVEL